MDEIGKVDDQGARIVHQAIVDHFVELGVPFLVVLARLPRDEHLALREAAHGPHVGVLEDDLVALEIGEAHVVSAAWMEVGARDEVAVRNSERRLGRGIGRGIRLGLGRGFRRRLRV